MSRNFKEIVKDFQRALNLSYQNTRNIVKVSERYLAELAEAEQGGGGSSDYSTTEHVVGKWIDGSDLYAKTITFTTGNTDAYLNHVTDIENPAMMTIDFSASYYILDDSTINATPYFGTPGSGDSNAFAVLCNKVDNKLRIDYRVGSSAYSKSAVVTVRYTKSST